MRDWGLGKWQMCREYDGLRCFFFDWETRKWNFVVGGGCVGYICNLNIFSTSASLNFNFRVWQVWWDRIPIWVDLSKGVLGTWLQGRTWEWIACCKKRSCNVVFHVTGRHIGITWKIVIGNLPILVYFSLAGLSLTATVDLLASEKVYLHSRVSS